MWFPEIIDDWDQADLVVLVGSNTAWCHPVLFQRLMCARASRGTKIVVIDPRRTATCEGADLHLPLALGTDVALFAGLLVYLADAGAIKPDWMNAHTMGFAGSLEAARQFAGTPAQVSAITKLPAEAVACLLRDVRAHRTGDDGLFARRQSVLGWDRQGQCHYQLPFGDRRALEGPAWGRFR